MRRSGLVVAIMMSGFGCSVGASNMAASTYGKGSVYRSASAFVELAADQTFNPAVKMLLERGDIEITDLKEADNRCRAVAGEHKLTFKVVDAGPGRSRLSMVVGGGNDPDANQELANVLMTAICGRLPVACEGQTSSD